MKLRLFSMLLIFSLLSDRSFAMQWNDVRPIIDKMLSYYESCQDYSMVVYDEWMLSDGNKEAVGDTVFVHKHGDYGYVKDGHRRQVYTPKLDIHIDDEDKTMTVRAVSPEELAATAQMMPSMDAAIHHFELCDSAKIIAEDSEIYTVDFYYTHPLVNRTRMVIEKLSGRIKEMYRYFTQPEQHLAQHTIYVKMEALKTSSIPEFDSNNYVRIIQENKILKIYPVGQYRDYDVQWIEF